MNHYSRRGFIRTGLTGIAALSVLPYLKACSRSINDTIRLGFIGLGRQSLFLSNGFNKIPGVKIVAGCDVYGIKRLRFEQNIRMRQEEKGEQIEVTTYHNYQDLLARKDLDAVVIASPDHWHAIQTIDACKAGKDIYLEKPTTFTIEEGKKVIEAVRRNKIICAVGSQQRSDKNFQHAVKMVRDGNIGPLKKISAYVGPPPKPYDLPMETIPADLDWNEWIGPNPYVHYNQKLNPPISLIPEQNETFWAEWRYYKEVGGGFLCDWGAHNFDIGQWALGKDQSGPVEIIPAGYDGHEHITFLYDNGVVMVNEPIDEKKSFGVKFWSDDAWIEVRRGRYEASDDSLLPPPKEDTGDAVPYETATPHLLDFIAALRENRDPFVPIETGHKTASLGILGNIATDFARPLKWNPQTESFINDTDAEKCLHRQYRDGYKLES
jgi:predicted dehydrogenase